jgi:hypothetical protein
VRVAMVGMVGLVVIVVIVRAVVMVGMAGCFGWNGWDGCDGCVSCADCDGWLYIPCIKKFCSGCCNCYASCKASTKSCSNFWFSATTFLSFPPPSSEILSHFCHISIDGFHTSTGESSSLSIK